MKVCILLAMVLAVGTADLRCHATPEEKVVQEQEDKNRCDDGFLVRAAKNYPKMVAACIVLPVAALVWQNYWLADDNETLELLNRTLVAMKNALEERLADTQKTLAERDEFIKTTFHEINKRLDILGLAKQLVPQK